MADLLTPIDSLRTIIQNVYTQLPVREAPMVSLLSKTPAYQKSIHWPVNVGGQAVGARTVGEANVANTAVDETKMAQLGIGTFIAYTKFSIEDLDSTVAQNIAPAALVDLYGRKLQSSLDKLMEQVNEKCYLGTGVKSDYGIVGLEEATGGGVYAGIDPATDADWDAYVNANAGTGRDLSRELLEEMDAQIGVNGGRYDVIFTTYEMVKEYKLAFAGDTATSVNVTPMSGIDLGFARPSYNGVPLVADRNCPAGKMYFVDSRGAQLHTFDASGAKPASPRAQAYRDLSVMGMNIRLADVSEPSETYTSTYELTCFPQLQVENRLKHVAVLADLNQ